MTAPLFKGVITALITPLRDGKVDELAFTRLLERQIAAGIHGVVPMGTTGESASLTPDEHKQVVDLCVRVAAGRVRVIAGAGSSATDKAIELVRYAKTAGAGAETDEGDALAAQVESHVAAWRQNWTSAMATPMMPAIMASIQKRIVTCVSDQPSISKW